MDTVFRVKQRPPLRVHRGLNLLGIPNKRGRASSRKLHIQTVIAVAHDIDFSTLQKLTLHHTSSGVVVGSINHPYFILMMRYDPSDREQSV